MKSPRRLTVRFALIAACAALCLAQTACSSGAAKPPGSGHHAGSGKPASSEPPAQPATGPAGAAAVKTMWQTVFNGAVPIQRRLGLLQDGQQFASFVRSQAKTSLGALVLAATAKVSSVKLGPSGRASVTYTILLGGRPVAKNLAGTAVYAAGKWQVAVSTFCSLLRVAYGKKSHLIPAACGS